MLYDAGMSRWGRYRLVSDLATAASSAVFAHPGAASSVTCSGCLWGECHLEDTALTAPTRAASPRFLSSSIATSAHTNTIASSGTQG